LSAVGSPACTARLFAFKRTVAPPFFSVEAFLAKRLTPFAGVN
jgi:hypothetical protein